MTRNLIEVVYAIGQRGEYYHAPVPVDYRRGTWLMKELIPPTQLAALARYANTLQKGTR